MLKSATISELIDRYDGFLFDAFGVLVDLQSALPGSKEVLETLETRGKPFRILTNSVFPALACSEKMRKKGLHVDPSLIISSGDLLKDWLSAGQIIRHPEPLDSARGKLRRGISPQGLKVYVLGGYPTARVIESWGMTWTTRDDFDVMVIGDQGDEDDLTQALDDGVSALYSQMNSGKIPKIVLPNPDITYPKSGGQFGITSGAMGRVVSAALRAKEPGLKIPIIKLGKPSRKIFQKALSFFSPQDNVIMIGDQLLTDIRGANSVGIDSALILTGVTSNLKTIEQSSIQPTFYLEGF